MHCRHCCALWHIKSWWRSCQTHFLSWWSEIRSPQKEIDVPSSAIITLFCGIKNASNQHYIFSLRVVQNLKFLTTTHRVPNEEMTLSMGDITVVPGRYKYFSSNLEPIPPTIKNSSSWIQYKTNNFNQKIIWFSKPVF